MKKNFCKILATALAAMMMLCTVALADASMVTPTVSDKVVTVNLEGLTASEEATVLVVPAGTTLANVTTSDIVYIDQLTVNSEGKVTFTFDATNVTAEKVDIYSGYTNMDVAAGPLCATNVALSTAAPVVVYGDVNGDEAVDPTDAGLVLQYYVKAITEFPTANGVTAANVNGDDAIDPTDAGLILQRYTNNITAFPIESK